MLGKASLPANQLATLLGTSTPAAKPRQADPRWCGNKKIAETLIEVWDGRTGEVSGQGFVLPSKLLKSLQEGKLLCDQVRPREPSEPCGVRAR